MKIVVLATEQMEGEQLRRDLWAYLDSVSDGSADIRFFDEADRMLRSCVRETPEIAIIMLTENAGAELRVGRKLKSIYSQLVLILAGHRAEYALEGYRMGALYYLQLPAGWSDLEQGYQLCMAALRRKQDKLMLQMGKSSYALPFERIMYLQVSGKTTSIALYGESAPLQLRCPMKEICGQLTDRRFLPIFRNCIVNMDFIQELQADGLQMLDGRILSIRRHDQSRIFTECRVYLMGRPPSEKGMLSDLTHYKERLLLALRVANICVFEVALQQQAYTFFENAEAIFGVSDDIILSDVASYAKLPPEEYRRAVSAYFSHPEDEAVVAAAFQDVLAGRRAEYTARMKAGQTKFIWCHIVVQPLVRHGIPVRMLGVIMPLPARQQYRMNKRAEAKKQPPE